MGKTHFREQKNFNNLTSEKMYDLSFQANPS